MGWWTGERYSRFPGDPGVFHIRTVSDALDMLFFEAPRVGSCLKPLRVTVSSVRTIKRVGNLVCAKIEQGTLKLGDELVFWPTHNEKPCTGRVVKLEDDSAAVSM